MNGFKIFYKSYLETALGSFFFRGLGFLYRLFKFVICDSSTSTFINFIEDVFYLFFEKKNFTFFTNFLEFGKGHCVWYTLVSFSKDYGNIIVMSLHKLFNIFDCSLVFLIQFPEFSFEISFENWMSKNLIPRHSILFFITATFKNKIPGCIT